ncbi:MAG: 1-(5-phosphoribosyl)-5-[Bacteroidaceae bacterium]|nr:1-(5-phosphoribosyl)-5-[(5-phosphoribosylamino)methylideneamino]imidazole-4-carboxamide isomerase [Bacteroidaceae bacterium]
MKIELIPAIDIIDGKCVRLSQGDYGRRKEYNERPLEVAKRLEGAGIRRLHVVDLDGAVSSHIVNYRSLEVIASHTSLIVDFGGGLKTDDDLRIAFECGASMITGGSIAVKDPETFCRWLQTYGTERIILGADAKEKKVAVSGWKENSDLELLPFISDYVEKGISKVICTDISKDGMLQGPAVELYQEILEQHPTLHLIGSGGVGNSDDIRRLQDAGVPAVIFGKAMYEGHITLEELEMFNV